LSSSIDLINALNFFCFVLSVDRNSNSCHHLWIPFRKRWNLKNSWSLSIKKLRLIDAKSKNYKRNIQLSTLVKVIHEKQEIFFDTPIKISLKRL
jgi:hypothetical protein